jgi:hypothetical protein
MHNQVLDQVMMADNMLMANMVMDTLAIIATNHAHPQIDQLVIAIAYIATISLATTTSGTALIVQSIHIRDAVAMFHSTIKNNAAAMFHNTIVKHAAAMFHSTTTHANVNIVQSILVKDAAVMFHAIITSVLAAHNKIVAHSQHAHNLVMMAAHAKQFFNCVSYCQTGRKPLPV